MKLNRLSYFFLILVSSLFPELPVCSQNVNTSVKGRVTDAVTGQPLYYVYVILENTSAGALTDPEGRYNIVTRATSYKLKFSYIGYEPESRIISPGKEQIIDVALNPLHIRLGEVVVKPEKRVYSNRNNPAVDLIENVVRNKEKNRRENLDFYNYKKYEKIKFSLINLTTELPKAAPVKEYGFIFENLDTTRPDGKKSLPFFIRETSSDFYFRRIPRGRKEIINGEKTINMNEYLDNKGITANLNYLYQNIDIYENEIFFLTNKFLSPVASEAPSFYRYFIIDTVPVNNTSCFKLFFEPRNPADFMFHGFLFVTADSSYAIKGIDMSFNKGINIDWIKDVRIVQNFDLINGKAWMLSIDETSIDFGISPELPGISGQRSVSYSNYKINEPVADTLFAGPDIEFTDRQTERDDYFWESVRQPPLSKPERGIYNIVDSLRKMPSFKRRMNLIMLLTTDFLDLGKFEMGPVGNFFSYNPIEGSRIRFGGRTTPSFSRWIYFEPYLAYGFNDRQFKYNFTATYSLKGTSIYQFPVRSIKFNYRYDTRIPGQDLQFATGDNIFLSLKRGSDDKLFYDRTYRLEYLNEFENHFSYSLGYNFTTVVPAGALHFYSGEELQPIEETRSIDISEATMKLRYAPREEFYQGKIYRDPVPSKYPVIEFGYTFSPKGLGGDYEYHKLDLSVSKRFYLSIIGYTDITARAGAIFGSVPYPLLFIHNANQTYAYQRHSYNMMNFLEFVSDRYVSLNIDHSFNGFFVNKIPIIKKLKFREVVTCKILYGGVDEKNDPRSHTDLFRFPSDINGFPRTFTLDRKPYIEASAGFSNILRIFRVDLIKRFTYTDNPDVSELGVRVQFRFDF